MYFQTWMPIIWLVSLLSTQQSTSKVVRRYGKKQLQIVDCTVSIEKTLLPWCSSKQLGYTECLSHIDTVQQACRHQHTVTFAAVETMAIKLQAKAVAVAEGSTGSNGSYHWDKLFASGSGPSNLHHQNNHQQFPAAIPTFHSLLVNTLIQGTVPTSNQNQNPITLSRSQQDTALIWDKRKHDKLRGAAPTNMEDRDGWDAHVDFLLTNYVSLIETFLHAYLRTQHVQTELVLGHTGFHYEKARSLIHIFADPRVETVCEIGFNAGHSALNALLARTGIQVISFDLGEYWDAYSKHSYQLLNTSFPNQLDIVLGDSTVTVPQFVRDRPDVKCNVIFVDGGHTKEVAAADIFNMAPLANRSFHRLVVDDYDWLPVREAFEDAVKHRFVKETGVIESNYCSSYDLANLRDATFGLTVPVLSRGENSGPANPEVLSAQGGMVIGEYTFHVEK